MTVASMERSIWAIGIPFKFDLAHKSTRIRHLFLCQLSMTSHSPAQAQASPAPWRSSRPLSRHCAAAALHSLLACRAPRSTTRGPVTTTSTTNQVYLREGHGQWCITSFETKIANLKGNPKMVMILEQKEVLGNHGKPLS